VRFAFLRDSRSENPAFWEAYGEGRAELDRIRAEGPTENLLRLLGALGSYARVLHRLDEAIDFLTEALELSRFLDKKSFEAANLIRLGTAYQYAGQAHQAEVLFKQALDLTEEPEAASYRDFAWQHLGKLLVEEGLFQEGRHCLEVALKIRIAKGDAELIHSTQSALSALRALENDPYSPY